MSQIRKEIASLLTASAATKPVEILKGFVLLRYLTPEMFGFLNIISQVVSLSKYGDFGFSSVLDREYNYERVRNASYAERIRNVAFTGEIIGCFLIFLIIITASFYYMGERVVFVGIISSAFLFLLTKIIKLYSVDLSIKKEFIDFARIAAYTVLSSSILIIATIPFLGIYAPILMPIASYSAIVAYLKLKNRFRFSPDLDLAELKRQIGVGLQLGGLTMLTGAGLYMERYLVLKNLGLREVGYYAFSAFIIGFAQLSIYNFTRPLMPRVKEELGKGNWEVLKAYVAKPTFMLLPVVLLGIFGLKAIVPYLAQEFFPQYGDAVPAFQVLVFAVYFIALTAFCGYLTYSPGIGRLPYAYATHIVYLVALVIGSHFFLKIHYDLLAIGKAIVVGHFFKSLLQNAFIFRHIYPHGKSVALLAATHGIPMVLFITIFF